MSIYFLPITTPLIKAQRFDCLKVSMEDYPLRVFEKLVHLKQGLSIGRPFLVILSRSFIPLPPGDIYSIRRTEVLRGIKQARYCPAPMTQRSPSLPVTF